MSFPSNSPFRLPVRIEPNPEARKAFEEARTRKVEGGPQGRPAPTFRDSLERIRAAVEEFRAEMLDPKGLCQEVEDAIANSNLERG